MIEDVKKLNEMIYKSISPEEINTFQQLFKVIDEDNCGKLSFEEVTNFIKNKQGDITEEKIFQILNSMN